MRTLVFAAVVFLSACGAPQKAASPRTPTPGVELQEAVFAGGCFWCAEHDFEKLPGVIEAVSGYTGGTLPEPTYEDVVTETTGHYESVRVRYDPSVTSYKTLVDAFWRLVDPTDAGGQFCDRGPSYRTAVFATDAQRAEAEASKAEARAALGKPVVTEILPLGRFYDAEEYHQDYADKNPLRYQYYRTACGRDARIRAVWGAKP